MSKYLFFYSVIATAVVAALCAGGGSLLKENRRLKGNQTALCNDVVRYRTAAEEAAASVQALRLRCGEYEEMRAADAERIRSMGIRLRRLEAVATTHTESSIRIKAPLRDTIIERDTILLCDTLRIRDTIRLFHWQDAWVTVSGSIDSTEVECRVRSIDTLRQIVHRIPRRFLFFRYGTKAIRQEIISSNPHTQIVYTEYIELSRRRRR
ncbi:MAG: hypothetical protein IJ348_07590 [Alistipes sp.]|nr:hypothetical protein [Alistipes sp.]